MTSMSMLSQSSVGLLSQRMLLVSRRLTPWQISGQIIMLHQPRFRWNKGNSLSKLPFWGEVLWGRYNLTRKIVVWNLVRHHPHRPGTTECKSSSTHDLGVVGWGWKKMWVNLGSSIIPYHTNHTNPAPSGQTKQPHATGVINMKTNPNNALIL